MAYIGKEPVRGQNRELDDISGSFNGSTTAFTMQVGGLNTSAGSVNQLFISVGGVLQNPGTDFTVAASTLTFTTAPASGLDFWGIIQGDAVDINTPADDSVTNSKILNDTIKEVKLDIDNTPTNGHVLTADATTGGGMKWAAAEASTITTQGDILYRGASDNARLAAGTSGYYLKTQGSGANPVWAEVSSGANPNLLINGAMQCSEYKESLPNITTSGYWTLDRWALNVSTYGTWSMSQYNNASIPGEFGYALKCECTTADGSPAAGDNAQLIQRIEAQNLQHLRYGESDAKSITLSFWNKSSLASKVVVVHLYQPDGSRHIAKSFTTASSGGSWQFTTLTFPGDTGGTINNDNGSGLEVQFFLGGGSNYTSGTLATSWAAYNAANTAAGQTFQLGGTATADFYVTGVKLEVGDTATDFVHESVQEVLSQCQRYFWQLIDYNNTSIAVASIYSATDLIWVNDHPVTMRASPSIRSNINDNTDYLIGRWYNGTGGNNGTGNINVQRVNRKTIMVYSAGWSLPATGAVSVESNSTSCYLGFSAEIN